MYMLFFFFFFFFFSSRRRHTRCSRDWSSDVCSSDLRDLHLGWRGTATLLAGEHGSGWRALLGFETGATPSASGLRYFFQTVGPAFFAELNPRFTDLLRQHHLFPERSTFPGDPADRGVTVTQDGMLHAARSRPSCQVATDACYQPLEPASLPPPPDADPPARGAETSPGRPCRARDNGREGC